MSVVSKLRHKGEIGIPDLMLQLFQSRRVFAIPALIAMKIRTLFIVLSLDHVENVEAKQLALLESPILEFKQMLGPSLETLYWTNRSSTRPPTLS